MTGSKGRGRNRNNGGKRPQGRGGNFDSGGRNRGNAQQLMDKYTALARDATQQGDRIAAENYYQHADHYYRVVNARNEQQEARRRTQNGNESGNTSDSAPVQNPDQNSDQNSGQNRGQEYGSSQASVDLDANQTNTNRTTADLNNATPKDDRSENIERQSEPAVAKAEPVQEAPPAKKPRRGRPPKKVAEESNESPAPEAAE